MKSATLLFLVVALIVVFHEVSAQGNTSSSAEYITGKVTAGSNPAPSVWVILYEGTNEKGRSLTGDDGRYYIGNIEKKTYTIVVRKQITGGNLVSQQVSLPANRVFDIRVP